MVCGWQTRRALDNACWYRLVERGFETLPAIQDGDVRRHASPQRAKPARPTMPSVSPHDANLPAWVGSAPYWQASPPPVEPERPERLAPSRPENVELGPLPAAASPLAARDAATNRFQRGKLLHALLQHLPDLPPEDRANAAARLARSARQ